jgi:hypothetical protein
MAMVRAIRSRCCTFIPAARRLLTSTLGAQTQTMLGASAAFHVLRGVDATINVGRAWYDARDVNSPGTQRPGDYEHLALSHIHKRVTITANLYRFGPRYATAILPYGIPENVWSVAWSWPGVWLKSTYQLVDNGIVGANREGYRLKYALDGGPLQIRATFARYRQIEPSTIQNVTQDGFVDGFFLPQQNQAGTIGSAQQYAAWVSWRQPFGNVTLDYVNDLQHRPFAPGYPEDYVNYVAPQAVLTLSRELSRRVLVALGYGRYAMRGIWATTPVDYGQNLAFAGAQFEESPHAALLVQARIHAFDGLPSIPNGPSPWFSGTLLVMEQRFRL